MLKTIEALIVIHNILHEYGDHGGDPDIFQDPEELPVVRHPPAAAARPPAREDPDRAHAEGVYRIKLLVDYAVDNAII